MECDGLWLRKVLLVACGFSRASNVNPSSRQRSRASSVTLTVMVSLSRYIRKSFYASSSEEKLRHRIYLQAIYGTLAYENGGGPCNTSVTPRRALSSEQISACSLALHVSGLVDKATLSDSEIGTSRT